MNGGAVTGATTTIGAKWITKQYHLRLLNAIPVVSVKNESDL